MGCTLSGLTSGKKEDEFSSYFYPNGTVTIQEDNSLLLKSGSYSAEADYQLNSDKRYIRNYTIGNIENNKADNSVNSNKTLVKALAQIEKKDLANHFQLIDTYGEEHVFKVLSSNSFHESPQKLTVSPGLYETLLNNGKPYNSFIQDVYSRNFYSHTATELQLKIAEFYVNLRAGIEYDNQQISSSLYCRENNKEHRTPAGNFYNNFTFADTKVDVTPSLRYKNYHWELRLDIPVSYHQYHLNYKEDSKEENKYRLYAEPKLNATYELNAYWKISSALNFYYQVPDINHFYANYIFTNYRNAFSGSGFYDYRSLVGNVVLKFNNPLNGLFWSAGGSIIPNWQDKMLSTKQDGILSSNEMLDIKHRNLYWNIRTRLSKSFGWWKLFTGVTGNYSQDRTKNLLSGEVIPYTSKNLSLAFNFSAQPCKYLSIEGNEKYLYSALSSKITKGVSAEYLNSNLSIHVFPSKDWKLKWTNQHLIGKKPVRSSIYFMDIAASYLWKTVEIELSINNILNKQNFRQTTYSSLSESTTLNYFLPREAILKTRMSF